MKKKKDFRICCRYVHVTLHNIESDSLDYWVDKANAFRSNVVACVVALEENHEEEKGLHAHIVIQFSTQQRLSREQFISHFGTDSVHITKPGKEKKDLMTILGYVTKTPNFKQEGEFTYKGNAISTSPEIYRFVSQVKSVEDGLAYFSKVIKENIKDKKIVEKYAKRDDEIGRWLQKYSSGHTKTLIKLAHTWHLDYVNSRKKGFGFAEFVEDKEALKKAYEEYLKEFPALFESHQEEDRPIILEKDYDQHVEHELERLGEIMRTLKKALEYGSNRPHKSKNLFIWSTSPSFGKSTLLKYLDDNMMCYRLPDDQYYIDYESGVYQVLVSDEAKAFLKTKSYSHLKHILEGAHVEFNMKNRTKIIKEDNPLIVLADNVSFDELMKILKPNEYSKEVMDTRVLDVQLKSRATLHFLLDRCLIKKTK